jgi:hypothetical protein
MSTVESSPMEIIDIFGLIYNILSKSSMNPLSLVCKKYYLWSMLACNNFIVNIMSDYINITNLGDLSIQDVNIKEHTVDCDVHKRPCQKWIKLRSLIGEKHPSDTFWVVNVKISSSDELPKTINESLDVLNGEVKSIKKITVIYNNMNIEYSYLTDLLNVYEEKIASVCFHNCTFNEGTIKLIKSLQKVVIYSPPEFVTTEDDDHYMDCTFFSNREDIILPQ